jgi:hypothetical protein
MTTATAPETPPKVETVETATPAQVKTRQRIIAAFLKSRDEYQKYLDSEKLPCPSHRFYEAVCAMVRATNSRDLPSDIRSLANRIEAFAIVLADWLATGRWHREPMSYAAGSSYEALCAAYLGYAKVQGEPFKEMETIEELTKQGVSDAQIAKMYGWIDAAGNGKWWMTQQERDNPGTHLGPGKWRDPRLVALENDELAAARTWSNLVALSNADQKIGRVFRMPPIDRDDASDSDEGDGPDDE